MRRGKGLSARELSEQLKNDPAYQAKLKAQAARARVVRAGEDKVLNDLANRGYPAESLSDLVNRHAPLPADLSGALLESLAATSDPALQEAIVRALGAARTAIDVQPLVQLFEGATSDSLRWAIANTFAELRPSGIGEWLLEALQTPTYGKAREMLALAVARTNPAAHANPVLLDLLDEMPGHVALALAESGTTDELTVLKERAASAKGWIKTELEKAVRAIRRRG